MSCSQATVFKNHASVMFPGHRFPESNRFYVHRKEGNTIKTDVMFPGHRIPQSNISHVPRPMVSRIKPQSCCQATGFQNQTVLMFPGHRVSESTDVMFPGHRIPQSNISHVPRPMVSRIKPQSYSQGTCFQNQTSIVFPGHTVPE